MSRISLLLVLLLVPSAAAQTSWSFSAPAQYEGSAHIENATWALLVFHDASTEATLTAEDATYTNITELRQRRTVDTPVFYERFSGQSHVRDEEQALGAVHAEARFGQWSSLYVQADRIRLDLADSPGRLDIVAADGGTLGPQDVPPGTYRPVLGQGVPGVILGSHHLAKTSFALQAEGVHQVEWHGAEVTCRGSPCPDGGGRVGEDIDADQAAVGAEVLYYARISTRQGNVWAQGSLVAVVVGAQSMDVAIQGWTRLPVAQTTRSCEGCLDPGGQTVTVEGLLHLAGLQRDPTDDARLHATASGKAVVLRLDEQAVDPALLGGLYPVVAVGVAAGLLAWALGILLTRDTSHPRRQRILEEITRNPGMTQREIARRLHLGKGNLRHHLDTLKRGGAIVEHQHGNTARYFENHGRFDAWSHVVVLRDPAVQRLHKWLGRHPGSMQAQILAQAQKWGWARSTTQDRLARLKEAGLLEVRRVGRRVLHHATQPS